MTLSYDFLHEHEIGRTSNESARTTMRSIGHISMYMGDYRIRDFLYNFNRHSKGERTNGVHYEKGERTIGSDHMKTLCIIRSYIYLISYYKSSSVCLFVCLSVCSLSPPRSFDRSSPNLVGVCRWTSELPLRGSFSKRSTARRVNGSLSLSTILYMCQPHSTQLQKATLLLLHLIRLKGTFCYIDGWWVYVSGSRNCLLDG